MRRRVPSLSGLQAFEAAARHVSFTRAADELHVTQSAISRAIRELEDELGTKLFRRHRQRVALSEAGEAYLPEVRNCLDRLEASTLELLARRREAGVLNLATMPTFGVKWLIPRVPEFMQRCPGVQINFISETGPVAFSARNVDAAIQYGKPEWPELRTDHLIGEELVPVCSPSFLNGPRRPRTPLELARLPLLHLGSIPSAWRDWFSVAGAGSVAVPSLPSFEHFAMCIQAAIAGMGIALMPHFLVVDDIKSGRLAVPFSISVNSAMAYYFVCPLKKAHLAPVRLFRDWLLQSAETTKRECRHLLSAISAHRLGCGLN